MSNELPAPSSTVRTVYLPDGTEVVEFTGSDLGVQPEWDKRVLVGAGLVIRGLSDGTFHQDGSPYPPARAILYNVIEAHFGPETYSDPPGTEPWGMLFSDRGYKEKDTSVIIDQVRDEFRRNGNRPFLTTIEFVVTVEAKGNNPERGYYKLARWVRNATPTSPKS